MIDTIEDVFNVTADIFNILVTAGLFGFVIYLTISLINMEISNRGMKKYLKKSEEKLIKELAKGDKNSDD